MYQAKNYDRLLGTAGFSETLLKNHFTLYQGYVTNTNKLSDALSALIAADKGATPEFAELKRRFGWEFNGMRLHEYYFDNMTKEAALFREDSKLATKMIQDFGSIATWKKEFLAVGTMRGIGWAVLYYDTIGGKLFNAWIGEHDLGHFAGAAPLLIMDVFEHAFMIDYGLKRADYIAAFVNAICWETVSKRFSDALNVQQVEAGSSCKA